MTARDGGDEMEGLSKKQKGLMDMDNSGDCWRELGLRGLKGNGEKKIKFKNIHKNI